MSGREIEMEIWRILKSKHTRDLVFIAVASLLILVAFICVSITYRPEKSLLPPIIAGFLGAFIGLLGWLYRTGSQRLTMVDAIASEIFSICRASAALSSVSRLVEIYRRGDARAIRSLQLSEEYNMMEKNILQVRTLDF
jgi:hypothetical protein